jgi:hypothetical protein
VLYNQARGVRESQYVAHELSNQLVVRGLREWQIIEELEQRLEGERPQELLDLIEKHLGSSRPVREDTGEEEEEEEEEEEGGTAGDAMAIDKT